MIDDPDGTLERLKGMNVLLAEDNVTNQLVATQMLKTLGADVDIASDGAIALERLKSASYDVLLIDIEMPRVSGLDVIRAVRASEGPIADAPIIALTAYAMREHRIKIEGAGADGLIPKPITSIKQFGLDILACVDRSAARAAGPAAAPPGRILIERTILDGLAASIGDDAMVDLLGKVEVDLKHCREDMFEAARDADADQMRGASHILISVAGAIGAVRLQRQSERLNRLAHDEAIEEMRTLSKDALAELDGVIAFVASERKEGAA